MAKKNKEDVLVIAKPARSVVMEVQEFMIVLHHVRCVYPVEEEGKGWAWSLKFSDGFYEKFHFDSKVECRHTREEFVDAVTAYWRES